MKPILFNTEMVRAILDGRKTVTRRVVNPQPAHNADVVPSPRPWTAFETETDMWHIKTPYHPGDILYVRETWTKLWYVDPNGYTHYDQPMYYYAADGTPDITLYDEDGFEQDDQRIRWHPSIHMPREAARIFLRVTDVEVQHVQDIDDEGCMAEGIQAWTKDGKLYKYYPADCEGDHPACDWQNCPKTQKEAMQRIWDSTINPAGRTIYGWDANPYVWRVSFERILKEEAFTNG